MITPSGMNAGESEASFSADVSARGASSTPKRTAAPAAPTSTGTISFSKLPGLDRGERAAVRLERELRRAARGEISHSAAIASAEMPCGTICQRSVSLLGEVAAVRAHRDARHHLDARRDDDVELAGPDRGRRVEVRLHRGAALPVDGRPADGFRPARGHRRHPGDVPALLADLGDAAHLHVLDLRRIEVVARDEAVQHLRREIVAADPRKRAVPLPDRTADGVDDQGVGHGVSVARPSTPTRSAASGRRGPAGRSAARDRAARPATARALARGRPVPRAGRGASRYRRAAPARTSRAGERCRA